MEIKLDKYLITYEDGEYSIDISIDKKDGKEIFHVEFKAEKEVTPPIINLNWDLAHIDIEGLWHPLGNIRRLVPNIWSPFLNSSSTISAPIAVLYAPSGNNRLTFSCTDAINPISYRFALQEENSVYLCAVKLFDGITMPSMEYSCDIVLDYRDIPYEDSISDVVKMWEKIYKPMPVYDECITPVYSTWYSFHQMAFADEMEKVIDSARPLGFASVIVDDGWQMEDSSRTYNWCGDWEVAPGKIPDMKAHVKKIHDMDMKYFLWYSLPFIGPESKAFMQFTGKYLTIGGVAIADPRYPDMREYLISKLEYAVKEWDIDGFKLDFIDNFKQPEPELENPAPGRDFESVPMAVEKFLTDIRDRLTTLKPEICIEFRQAYIGPLMRTFANMFRAADCANDMVDNKVRTIDLRLQMGDTPVHCDMLTWNKEDTVEAAALQLQAVMFAVPQISVRPYNLPESHNIMLKNWLDFWSENKMTLLRGKFRANEPSLLYTSASAEDENKYIAVSYAHNSVLSMPDNKKNEMIFVNASGRENLVIDMLPGNYTLSKYIFQSSY